MPIIHINGATSLLSPGTRLGYVHYTVADLEKQIAFYTQILGLQLHWKTSNEAGLGAGEADLIRFTKDKAATRYEQATGLYHQALLLPNRKELARAIARLFSYRYPNSPTDHTISQTTYLEDPEGNTIELLADTPEEGTWEVLENGLSVRDNQGKERHMSIALDVEALFRQLSPKDDIHQPMPADTITGHVHLYVNNLHTAMAFYRDVLGFQKQSIMHRYKMADTTLPGFNVHMIAFNIWKGENARPAPSPALGMRYFTVNLTSIEDRKKLVERLIHSQIVPIETSKGLLVNDPVGNGVIITLAS